MNNPFRSKAYRMQKSWLRAKQLHDMKDGEADHAEAVNFRFDGKPYQGLAGDNLASALIANGVRLFGRSFKYHRPRGLLSLGEEEPNALITLNKNHKMAQGSRQDPNQRAPLIKLQDGLDAHSQNARPSRHFDVMGMNRFFSKFLAAGFYYKTFMGPFANTKIWMFFEHFIRNAAGLGTASTLPDPDYYDEKTHYCDLLIVGAGGAGIQAARTALEAGKSVLLVEQRMEAGGRIIQESTTIDHQNPKQYIQDQLNALHQFSQFKLLTRTVAFGAYDHNMVCLMQQFDEPAQNAPPTLRQRLWWVRANHVSLAVGAIEQPLLFAGNDLPGVMLAGSVRGLLNHYGVCAGNRVIIACHQDEAWRTALDLAAAGAQIKAIIDQRPRAQISENLLEAAAQIGIAVYPNHVITQAYRAAGGLAAYVGSVSILNLERMQATKRLDCDLVAMSGGWQPALSLFSQAGGKLKWDQDRLIFKGAEDKALNYSILGRAAGTSSLTPIKHNYTGDFIKLILGHKLKVSDKIFIDFQNDVGLDDVKLALREGYDRPELLKRYTTMSMATDQGKTGLINAIIAQAILQEKQPSDIAHTTFRPPYQPIPMGSLTALRVGQHYRPLRRTPLDHLHEAQKVEWSENGLWRRARHYPIGNESLFDGYVRETKQVRFGVGIADVSTLGKIDIQGQDAAKFLDHVYSNLFSTLKIGKVRYGLMLREDGFVYDDGTTSRLGENHYLMTTTTAHAGGVMSKLELFHQRDYPDYDVKITSVTDQLAAIAVAGPKSRDLIQSLTDFDVSNDAFPFMNHAQIHLAGLDLRLFRISFSGELAYELMVGADYMPYLWKILLEHGKAFDIAPYGLEALGNLRIEKGHAAGPELNGRTSAHDLGFDKLLSKKKNFIGKAMALRPVLTDKNRLRMVAVTPKDGKTLLSGGAHLIARKQEKAESLGFLTSVGYSPELGKPIAQALLKGGLEQYEGQVLIMANPIEDQFIEVEVTSHHLIDPAGVRQNG